MAGDLIPIERIQRMIFLVRGQEEWDILKSQFVTSSWGGMRRAVPYAFTEQGVAIAKKDWVPHA